LKTDRTEHTSQISISAAPKSRPAPRPGGASLSPSRRGEEIKEKLGLGIRGC
jgi:hypothetical protein